MRMLLNPILTPENMEYILNFIDAMLYKIIHHRNLLKNYRSVVNTFNSLFNSLYVGLDFSENLKVPLKFEPHPMHWTKTSVTVYSGICKYNSNKSYHAYFSETKKHDAVFVNLAIGEMLKEVDTESCFDVIVIDSDICVEQFKKGEHFEDC